MDSCKSGSLQSSSGGDDEFDSRCDADSSPLAALLRQPPSPSVPGFGRGSLIYGGLQELSTPPLPQSNWCSTPPLPTGSDPSPPSVLCHDGLAAPAADQAPTQTAPAAPPRGSRKRARASRRAPLTVLTTDTSNFRAMVQEFTGIPAPPFAGASARSRFDHLSLFISRSADATLPQYLLHPFAQKLYASTGPYTSPSTSSQAPANVVIASTSTAVAPGATAVSPSNAYQLATVWPTALLGVQDHDGGSSSYLSFQGTHGAQLDAKYAAAHPVFDRGIAPSSSAPTLQDPGNFLVLPYGSSSIMGSDGTTHAHAHLHPRNASDRDRGGDVLSGLVGGASVAVTAGSCKAVYSSTPPLLERNGRSSPSAGVSTATTTPPVAAALQQQP